MARTKGATGAKRLDAQSIAISKGVDPFEVLLDIIKGDWKALGLKSQTITRYTAKGDAYQEDAIQLEHRLSAAKDAAKYIYPQQKAIEHSASDGIQLLAPLIIRPPVSQSESETG